MLPTMPTTTTTNAVISTAMSVAATAYLLRTFANDLIPDSVQAYLADSLSALLSRFSSRLTIVIDEFENRVPNHLFKAAEAYLAARISPSTRKLRASKQEAEDAIVISMDRGEELLDVFQGRPFRWRLVSRDSKSQLYDYRHRRNHYREVSTPAEARSFELSFHWKHKDFAVSSYLPFILDQAKVIKDEAKTLKLYTNENWEWTSTNLRHPATMETVAMEPETKKAVLDDLERFVKRREYYKRVGKAWKRGYLLYGPPGTGKSSLVAAMANYLRFDVYDLELTDVNNNAALRTLLAATANRSIIVVEDIDCSVDLQRKNSKEDDNKKEESYDEEKVTLSGLLNFVDGLWSSCGDERIIVFTTNHKDRLDPALLRPGRMDMHIHMSYCSPSGFRMLVSNYHAVDDHPLFPEINQLICQVEVTPAEVAEELMKSDDVEIALSGIVRVLKGKKKMQEIERGEEAN